MKLQIQLQGEAAGAAAQQFEVALDGKPVVLGRGPDSPVPLEGSKLSRSHLAFDASSGQLSVTDLSSNGLWVNALAIPKKTAIPVSPADEITIPGYRIHVRLLETLPPAPPVVPTAPPVAPSPPAPATTSVPPAPVSKPSVESVNRSTDELTVLQPAIVYLPQEPPWWHLSSGERLVLIFVALAIGLFAYYYALQ